MSDLVRIREATGPFFGMYYLERGRGITPNRDEAHLYPRDEAQRIKDMATTPLELEPVESGRRLSAPETAPACPKCAEMAAALAEIQHLYREADASMVETGLSKRPDKTDYAADSAAILAAHDAAKDAEIQILTAICGTLGRALQDKMGCFVRNLETQEMTLTVDRPTWLLWDKALSTAEVYNRDSGWGVVLGEKLSDAKDAEIERLRKGLADVVLVLQKENHPELEPWRRAELAGLYAKAALDGGQS